jgi:hypothetical protein
MTTVGNETATFGVLVYIHGMVYFPDPVENITIPLNK